MTGTLGGADLDALGTPGLDGELTPLLMLLRAIEDDLRELSDTITHYHFSHAELRIS
jgi:hypothetical protein